MTEIRIDRNQNQSCKNEEEIIVTFRRRGRVFVNNNRFIRF